LKNKTVIYTTTVQSIKDLVMPAEDLELAKKFGDYETFDDFMKDIRERLLKQKQQSQQNEYIENIVRQLVEKADIQYAPNALEEEAQEIFNDFKQRLAQQGVDLETYLKMKNTDMEKFLNEEIRPMRKSN
jgi:trigger factor